MAAREFNHSFTDERGNTIAYLHISSPEGSESGTVILHFAEKKSASTMENCCQMADMLGIESTKNLTNNTIVFHTKDGQMLDGFTAAMVLTRDLENKGFIGAGAYVSLEQALLDAGHIQRANPMEVALQQATENNIRPLHEMLEKINSPPVTNGPSAASEKPITKRGGIILG